MNDVTGERLWHVVYTIPKAERKVALSIDDLGLESYLPLHTVVRQWSDRKKKLRVPVFPNYVFVKVDTRTRAHLYSIKEVVRFVSISKTPVIVREEEILAIKKALDYAEDVVPEDYFQEGTKMRITKGQFAGLEGFIVRRNNNARLLVRIDGLLKAFSLNISPSLGEALR